MASLKEVMNKKSNEGLMDYLINFNKYTPEAIAAAVSELKRRGQIFTDEDQKEIDKKIQLRNEAEKEEDNLWRENSGKNVVTDPTAPLYYSQQAIMAFSVIFTVIFGAVLLASNIPDRNKRTMVIVFGIISTAIVIIVVNLIPTRTFPVYILNAVGGYGLISTFWNKYIGKDTKYRAKPIWKPLIISIIITIPFLLAIFYDL